MRDVIERKVAKEKKEIRASLLLKEYDEMSFKANRYDFLRPEVQKLAQAMEVELKNNDYKGGWKGCDLEFLIDKLNEEKDELIEVADRYSWVKHEVNTPDDEKEGLRKRVLSEAADVSNIAMMIADVLNALDS